MKYNKEQKQKELQKLRKVHLNMEIFREILEDHLINPQEINGDNLQIYGAQQVLIMKVYRTLLNIPTKDKDND